MRQTQAHSLTRSRFEQVPVQAETAFVDGLLSLAQRLHGSHDEPQQVAVQRPQATLEANQTLLPVGLHKGMGPTICVELKPKCGFLPTAASIAPEHRRLKTANSRYVLQQRLKLQQVLARRLTANQSIHRMGAEPACACFTFQNLVCTTCVQGDPAMVTSADAVTTRPTPGRSSIELQHLSLHMQGAIPRLSEYDPLELFSMDPDRMRRAVAALLDSPQNNLRVFRDGRPLPFRCCSVSLRLHTHCLRTQPLPITRRRVTVAH